MVVAFSALLLALSGTAVAASLISGSRLKNRSVSGKKIKVNSLTSKEVAESKLKAVPRAKFATQAFSAASSGGLQPKKISAHFPAGTDDTTVLELGGLTLIGSCSGGNPQLRARSNSNNAEIKGMVFGEGNPAGIGSDDMDVGSTVNLLSNKQQGIGNLVYTRPDGRIVQVDYAFADSPTEGGYQGCVFGGTGFAG
jgi:hypothetical protein